MLIKQNGGSITFGVERDADGDSLWVSGAHHLGEAQHGGGDSGGGAAAPATFAREHRREVDVEVDETAVLLVGVEAVAVLRSEQDHLLSATASMPLHGVPTPLIIDKIDRASCILSCIVFFQI